MNAAARALAQGYSIQNIWPFICQKTHIMTLFFAFFILLNALGVIYLKDLNRRYFSELESEQRLTHQLQVEWGQLLLERSTLTAPARVQRIATHHIEMQFPNKRALLVVPR